MEISFDPAKSERNATERSLPFKLVEVLYEQETKSRTD
jgi:uncharacterized DUF497 family protein